MQKHHHPPPTHSATVLAHFDVNETSALLRQKQI